MTKAHNDRILQSGKDKGYSIRVGKNLPANSANLAYVHTPKMSPKVNLFINDVSEKIKENGLPTTYQNEKLMFPDDSFLLRELSGTSRLPSRNIVLTDEFSIPVTSQDVPVPLYYHTKVRGRFDAKGATVTPYIGGYTDKPVERAVDYAQLSTQEKEDMLYLGSKIQITYLDGSPLKEEHKYKIRLVRETGSGLPQNNYVIYIYTNFKGSQDETFLVRYEKYNKNGTRISDYVEILNAYPFFNRVNKTKLDALAETPKHNNEWRKELLNQEFSIVEAGEGTYEVYAPSQVIVANNTTRPAHQFKYKVNADLKTRLSSSNPGTVNIGIAFLNNAVFNIENLRGTLWKLYEDNLRPNYLDFTNPHPPTVDSIKSSGRYWSVDLEMPEDHYDDYDVIILTGYGFYNMSKYNDALRRFLENGGKIWIDNAGAGQNALTFTMQDGTETFLTNIGFSRTTSESGFKTRGANGAGYLDRLYMISDEQVDIGYTGVNPRITFRDGEDAAHWKSVIRYSNGRPSVIYRTMFEKGTILVSNCGIFRSLFHDEEVDIKFSMNTILSFAETKTIHTPWIQDYVYHRDNLFAEEYKGINGQTVYVDDRNDRDSSQIVAKKIISKTTRQGVQPYLPKSFYAATGTYTVEAESNSQVPVVNGNVENGAFNSQSGRAITSWTATSLNAIPGWSTAHLAGSTPQFRHITSLSQRGEKALQITANNDGVGSHAFWYNELKQLVAGVYKATVWMKVSNADGLSGSGPAIGIYNLAGQQLAISNVIIGTRDWVRVDVEFSISSIQDIHIRIGFIDGNGHGTVFIDYLNVHSIGSVYVTPKNNGSLPLYAYAVRPRGDSINLRAEGFATSDITTYDPEVNVTYTIRSFVYTWDNFMGRMVRNYGRFSTYTTKIRRSDGIVALGSVSTLIPELLGGSSWANRNNVYYEVFLGSEAGVDTDSQFVNLEIYDMQSGRYFYTKNGETLIRDRDLFFNGEQNQIILQARTNYYTVRATKRRYGVLVRDESKIELAHPSTIDNRDCWFLRVHNGAFVKNELSYADLKELQEYDSRYYAYQQRIFGTHYYSLPEYDRQVFKPVRGIKRKTREMAEYVNDNTIRVQNAPLYVRRGSVRGEQLNAIDADKRIYKSENNGWLKSFIPKIYVDTNHDGNYIVWTNGFDYDYENGCVLFDETMTGNVKADYEFNNLRVIKRSYNNTKITRERALTSDGKVFTSKNKNWLAYPTPIVKMVPYANENEERIIPTNLFTIDYDAGVVIFKEEVSDQVYFDYAYSNDKELVVRDYDIQSGLIYLEAPIDFKDDIYVDYYYEENFLEYRGYWNQDVGRFIHLDLNPSEGHYSTMPVVRGEETMWEQVPTAKLMNKEVYVYILPYKNSFGDRTQHTVRHCYGLEDWQQTQKTWPTALLLGVIHLREHTKVTDAVVLDTRIRGGGLKQSITDREISRREPLAYSYWDMGTWDGKAYYKNGTIVIEVPKKVLKIEGGQFTEQQVREIIGKYVAYGVYYIVEFV